MRWPFGLVSKPGPRVPNSSVNRSRFTEAFVIRPLLLGPDAHEYQKGPDVRRDAYVIEASGTVVFSLPWSAFVLFLLSLTYKMIRCSDVPTSVRFDDSRTTVGPMSRVAGQSRPTS